MSRFTDALAAGLNQIRKQAGEPITYSAGADSVSIPLAVPRRITANDSQQYEQHILSNSRLWDIERALLTVESAAFNPHRGHVITEADGTAWEVVDNPVTGKCWEYVDSGKNYIKVFTLRKGP